MKFKVLAGMLVATAAMAMTPIEDLNKAVVQLLAPFNNNLTSTRLEFTDLEVDDVRALKAGLKAAYTKQGELTNLHFVIPELSYDYNAAAGPSAKFNLAVKTHLPSIVEQEVINEMGPLVSEIVTDMAQDFLKEYGPAAEVEVKTVNEEYDKDGNLISINVVGRVKVSLSKLPEEVPVESVPVTAVDVQLMAGMAGMSAEGTVVMNKKYKAFEEDQEGLKEVIELLLRQEPETMESLQLMVGFVDEIVGRAINEGFKEEELK